MARKKVKLAFISNDTQRKATYSKRKKGLIKKVTELSTLCDVKACAIIYGPYDETPEVWPSIEGATMVVEEFKNLPELDQQNKNVDQQAYLKQRINKTDKNVKKIKKESRELELTQILSQSFTGSLSQYNMNVMDLNDLGYLIDRFSKTIMHNIQIQHESGIEIGESSNVAAAASEGIASTMVMEMLTNHPVQLSNAYHNQQQHQPQPHHPTTGDSTNSTDVPSLNNDVPATHPNPTNNV